MNLWGRFGKWALLISAPILFSCEDPNEIGVELEPNKDNVTTLFKEFTLPTSVVFSDSVATNDPNELIMGVYDDPSFGRTKIISYTQLGAFQGDGGQFQVSPDAIFDSVRLYMHIKYFFGDNFLEPQKISIHEIRDTLFRDIIYKSTVRTSIKSDPVGELEFQTTAGVDSVLIIKLEEEYGEKLLEFASGNTLITSEQEEFQEEIPPLAFVPDDDNDYILGIEAAIQARDSIRVEESSAIRVFYHLDTDVPIFARWFDYTIDGLAQYQYVENDRSRSALAGITTPFEEFVPPDNRRYVNPLTGINTKIDMSPVWDFIDSLDGFVINQALFEIEDVIDVGGPDDFVTSLENISLLFTDERNKINGRTIFTTSNLQSVVLDDGSYNSAQTSNPLRIGYVPEQLMYRAEISNYLQAAADSVLARDDLLIYPLILRINPRVEELRAMDQLIFDANNIKLKLFYTTIQ